MRMSKLTAPLIGLALSTFAAPAFADEAARAATARHFEAGTLAAGDAELSAMIAADLGNADARLGLGMIRFVAAVEHLSQSLYRYGLDVPRGTILPILRLPVSVNPDPEPLTYAGFRDVLQDFVDDLQTAETTLATVGDGAQVPFDLTRVAYDMDGDGTVAKNERLLAAMVAVTGLRTSAIPEGLEVKFDTADAIWLRGYTHVLMALGEFLLAHDWHENFEASFHLFFPSMPSPMTAVLRPPENTDYWSSGEIFDALSFIHLLRWQVSEPARLAAVHAHLTQVVALSRQNWDAIEAETDNDREWVPNPNQDSALVQLDITADQIAAWRAVLDELDAILAGEKLIPHFRFTQGVNFRRVLLEPTTFDLVLWITGPAALPYLEDGPISTDTDWNDLTRAFGSGFGAYAVWFN